MQTTRDGVIKPVKLLLCSLQFSTKYPLTLCNIRLCGIAVNHWRMTIQKIILFSRDGSLDVRWQSRECWEFILPTRGLCGVVSCPGGSVVEPQLQTIFGRFVRFYACMHYASIIRNRTSPEGRDSSPCLLSAGVETMEAGLRFGSYMFCRRHIYRYSIVEHCKMKNSRPILNFARFDSLVCIVARSRHKSRSPHFSLAAARSRLHV